MDISNKVLEFKMLLDDEFVPKSELNPNDKSKSASTKDSKVNQCVLLRNYLYGSDL